MARWSGARGALLAAALVAGACGDTERDDAEGREPGGCQSACEDGTSCVDGACVQDADGDGVPDEADRCDGTPAGAEVNAEGCAFEEEPVPLPAAPYDTGIRDRAGDFTVQTLTGSYSLHGGWTGRESHLFLAHVGGEEYGEALWASDPGELLAASPRNVHYLFLDTTAEEAERLSNLEALQERVEAALAALPQADAEHWRSRLHFVTDDVRELDGSLGAFFAERPAFAFGIDRFGRWREAGLLADVGTGEPAMSYLAKEAEGFEYERRLERRMGALDATEVVVFDGDRHQGGWEDGYGTSVEVDFPDAATLARFDSMAVYLYTACPDHLQGLQAGCNEWDYAHHLFLCDADDPEACDTELVRYVTSFGREGEWLTDISPLLPLLEGGKRTLRYEGANGYDMHLRFLFWDAGKSHRPTEARFLYGQSGPIAWDEAYNGHFEPVAFTVDDPSTAKVEIYSVVTGHGFGATWDNCAEFCDSEHEFAVNGTAFTESHPEATDELGCFGQVLEGVVPNQFGTWPFGRAGWCPGQDVKPWVQDVSDALVSGENAIAYRALRRGEPYTPPVRDEEGYLPELRLQSWLIRYEAR